MYAVAMAPVLLIKRPRRLFASATADLLVICVSSHVHKISRVRSAMDRASVQYKRTAQWLEQCACVIWVLLVLDVRKPALEGLPVFLAQGMVGAHLLVQQAPAVSPQRMKHKKWCSKR